jgi:alkane 1-monooxygenase
MVIDIIHPTTTAQDTTPQDTTPPVARYVDGKRYWWLASLSGPLIPMLSIAAYLHTGWAACLLAPLIYILGWIPLADSIFGEDSHNPPESAVPQLASDRFYAQLLYADIALLYAGFLMAAWLVGTHALPIWALLGFTLGVALTSADAILLGHELGHKQRWVDQLAARIALALVGYGHFIIEHNRGHHVYMATPEDCASSRMGESVYRFACRELPGALCRGWSLEKKRLARLGHPPLSLHNEILQTGALTLAIALGLVALLGPKLLLFVVLHHAYAWYGLTQANYVEHYGLLRQKLAHGRYEPPQPRHSWNTNHIYSNLISFHLQRHSDHHAHPTRPYQVLRDQPDLPRLPSGYPGCFGLAMIPSLWFKTMDPKLLAWAGGDITKLNVDPARRAELYARYGASPPGCAATKDAMISSNRSSVPRLEATSCNARSPARALSSAADSSFARAA